MNTSNLIQATIISKFAKNIATICILLISASILPPAYADQVALPFNISDGLENNWVITKSGELRGPKIYNFSSKSYPSRYAGKVGIQGGVKSQESATRAVKESGTEIQIGPMVAGSVFLTRKVYFGKDEGYVRYLDIIENRSSSPTTTNISIYSKPVNYSLVWADEGVSVASGSRGGVAIETFYGDGDVVKPTKVFKEDSLGARWDELSIPPESKVALLRFIAIRPNKEQALDFAQSFNIAPASKDIDPSDLASIVNFDPRTLGAKAGIEIFRGDDKEAVLLKSGDQLTGVVQDEKFLIQTSYAQLEFAAKDIATVIYEGGANNIERVILLNGDVFSGFILDPEVTVKLDAGPVINIRKEKISRLGFRIRSNEKDKYPVIHDVTLTNGDHFSGTVKNPSLKIAAAFGDIPIQIEQIAKIEFISKKGTVTEITMRNGDTVSGFLKDEDLVIDLDFGREVSIYQDRIEKIIFDKDLLQKIAGEALKGAEAEKAN